MQTESIHPLMSVKGQPAASTGSLKTGHGWVSGSDKSAPKAAATFGSVFAQVSTSGEAVEMPTTIGDPQVAEAEPDVSEDAEEESDDSLRLERKTDPEETDDLIEWPLPDTGVPQEGRTDVNSSATRQPEKGPQQAIERVASQVRTDKVESTRMPDVARTEMSGAISQHQTVAMTDVSLQPGFEPSVEIVSANVSLPEPQRETEGHFVSPTESKENAARSASEMRNHNGLQTPVVAVASSPLEAPENDKTHSEFRPSKSVFEADIGIKTSSANSPRVASAGVTEPMLLVPGVDRENPKGHARKEIPSLDLASPVNLTAVSNSSALTSIQPVTIERDRISSLADMTARQALATGEAGGLGLQVQTLDGESILHVLPRSDMTMMQPAAPQIDFSAIRPEVVRNAAANAVEVLVRQPGQSVDISLDPKELGRVRMALSTSETGMTVVITAERPETQELMRRNIDQLAQEFQSLGYENMSFEFQGESADRDGASDSSPSDTRPDHDAVESARTPKAYRLASTGLDLRL